MWSWIRYNHPVKVLSFERKIIQNMHIYKKLPDRNFLLQAFSVRIVDVFSLFFSHFSQLNGSDAYSESRPSPTPSHWKCYRVWLEIESQVKQYLFTLLHHIVVTSMHGLLNLKQNTHIITHIQKVKDLDITYIYINTPSVVAHRKKTLIKLW